MKRSVRYLVMAAVAAAALVVLWRLWPQGRAKGPPASPAAEAGHGHGHGHGHTPIDEPELREGPGAILGQDDPAGTLRLEGLVLDAAERPVEGAVVALGSSPPKEVRTNAGGAFVVEGLLPRAYAVAVRAPAGVAGPMTARPTATSAPVVLRLRPGAQVDVEVVDARQQPVGGATVELRGPADQIAQASAGTAMFSSVVPGPYTVVAWADGYARAYLPAIVAAGASTVRLELARGAPVSGRVLDEKGAPIAGARVRFDSAADFGPGATGGSGFRDAVITGADGAFIFESLPAGSFRFLANHADYAPNVSSLISLDGQSAKTDVELVLPAGASVSGLVVDERGQPVPSARVRVGVAAMGFRATAPPRETYSDAGGAFTVRGMPRRELVVVALHETGASSTAVVDAASGEVREVKLVIDATGTIAGVVVDARGKPVEGAHVSGVPDIFGRKRGEAPSGAGPAGGPAQWQLRGFPQGLTDADGRFRLTGLPSGAYRLRATRAAAVSRGRGLAGDDVIAKAGDEAVRVALPAEGAIRGKVTFADGSSPARLTVAIGFSQQSFTDGQLALDALSPQRYQLVLRGSSFETRVLDAVVEPGKTTELGTIVVTAGRKLGGVVLFEGKPVAGATVYAGAWLVGSRLRAADGPSASARAPGGEAQQATTGADGTFTLEGFADVELVVVAEHRSHGRSRPLRWGTGTGQDVVRLALLAYGSLRGRVTGAPLGDGVMVIAQSMSAPAAAAKVGVGPDGVFRFEQLAPDVYKVSATTGSHETGMRQTSAQVEVSSGKEAQLDLAVTRGAITLEAEVKTAQGQPGLVIWVLAPGRLIARTDRELRASAATAGAGASQQGIGRPPLRIAEVGAGAHTLCIVPLPRELDSPSHALTYAERYDGSLAVVCETLEVRAAPTRQRLTLNATVPAFVSDASPALGPARK